jgi:molybdopterin-guanine dinucleotide biosynthesis protein A
VADLNRPTHIFNTPDQAIKLLLAANHLPRNLPRVKKVAADALGAGYPDRQQAHAGINTAIGGFYADRYPELLHGARFIDHVYRVMNDLFEEVLIVSNSPELYAAIDCRKVPDIYCAKGVLAGIHAGLVHARSDRIFVVGCDMPFINPQVVRAICTGDWPEDVVIPVLQGGHEPLHALYGRNCITAIEEQLQAGRKRIISFFPWVNVRGLGAEHWQESDPEGLSFRNINTPEEYFQLRGEPVSLGLSSKEQQRESG